MRGATGPLGFLTGRAFGIADMGINGQFFRGELVILVYCLTLHCFLDMLASCYDL
jgi:hypothetical protein